MRVIRIIVFAVVLLAATQMVFSYQNSPCMSLRQALRSGQKKSNAPVNTPRMADGNASRLISPAILNRDWPILERLLLVVFCATLGTTINGFFVASFFIEDNLKREENIYLRCMGLSDLILTAVVMPASAVVMMSTGEWDSLPVCRGVQFLTETATYSFSLFFLFISMESCLRTCGCNIEHYVFRRSCVCVQLVPLLVFLISAVLAAAGVYYNLDIDYCECTHLGNFDYRIATLITFHILPAVISLACLIFSIICTSRRARKQRTYRHSWQHEWDSSISKLSLSAFCLFLIFWMPFLVILYIYPVSDDPRIYNFVCIGLSRSIFGSVLYCGINQHFRRAFLRLYYYCCCKNPLTGSIGYWHRRVLANAPRPTNTSVHIMQQAILYRSSQRGTPRHEVIEL